MTHDTFWTTILRRYAQDMQNIKDTQMKFQPWLQNPKIVFVTNEWKLYF